MPSRMLLPQVWGSHASPTPSWSRSDWVGFGTPGQLSVASPTPSPSSSVEHWTQPLAASHASKQGASTGQPATHRPESTWQNGAQNSVVQPSRQDLNACQQASVQAVVLAVQPARQVLQLAVSQAVT